MRPATNLLPCFASVFLLAFIAGTGTAPADSIHAGGPLLPGQARPPLHINTTPSGSVYYSPAQIRHAYGVDQLSSIGTGQTIAIVDAYGSPSMQSDLNTFCSTFKLPAITVPVYYAQGKPGRNTGWAQETALDVEWAHAIAPGARIVLVVAQSASLNNLLGAVDYAVNTLGANVVSMSWGGSESSSEVQWDSHFNVPGVTFVASSGDNGESTGVEWPAASPYVLSVGGTSLRLDANNNRASETAWSGSGGGISVVEPLPGYQSGWLAASGRGVPDVSFVGDPSTGVEVVYGGRLYVFGGTSVGAPQWAALIALSNSLRSPAGVLNNADTALYSLANLNSTYQLNSSYFYDITSGNNGSDPDDYAVPSYDLVTGLGSPFAASLIPALTAK
ncbi:MAG TPA: S53 family peptidase [Candidatus Limnocylindrales bacterium]|jgi:subtilase family serine protease|nr:S53 family peptidase [Candidatus Limnocylindrales bacterium]